MKNKRYEREVFIKDAYNIVKKYGFENLTVKRLSTYFTDFKWSYLHPV